MKQLSKTILFAVLYFAASFGINAQPYGTFTHNVSEDSYVRGGEYAAIPNGSEVNLFVKAAATTIKNYRKAVLKFDLTGTSYNLTGSDKAVLRLQTNSVPISTTTTITAYELGDTWTESAVTWNNLPTIGTQIASVVVGTSGLYYEWDVTAYVKSQLAGDKIVSIALDDPNSTSTTIGFNSKESGANIPYLSITSADPNVSTSISATKDAKVYYWGLAPYDKNYGSTSDLVARYDDNVSSCNDSYIQFNISSISAAKEKILLRLYASAVARSTQISVFGTDTEASWSETTITGRTKPLATERIGIYPVTTTGLVDFDITNYVNKAIAAGWSTITLILKENDGTKITFNSKEASSDGPKLMVSTIAGSYVAPVVLSGTYYFDSVNGNDANNGTSEATAWKSLAKLNGTTLAAGTKMLLKRGSVWSNEKIMFKGSGTNRNPIVLDAYGTGNKPLLQGLGQLTELIWLFNQEYIEISNLHITNLGAIKDGLRRGIFVVADNFGAVHHLQFTNLELTDINGTDGYDGGIYANSDDAKRTGAIFFEIRGDDVQTYFDDLLIDKSYFYNVSNAGIANVSHWSELLLNSDWSSNTIPGTSDADYVHNFVPSKNVVIKRNRFEQIYAQGLIVRTAENPIMEYNLFYYNSIGKASDNACFNSKTMGALWRYNEACFTEYTDGKSDGAGIDSDLRSKNTVIEYNYCHDNGYGGVITTGGSNTASFNDNTIVRYNVLINNGLNSIRICNQNTNFLAHNNIVYYDNATAGNSLVFTHISDVTPIGPRNSVISNNIFYTTNNNGTFTADVASTDSRFEEVKYNNNLYYGIDAAYQYPNDAQKITANPLFINGTVPTQQTGGYVLLDSAGMPTGSVSYDFLAGFGLSATSLAINKGSVVGISTIPSVDFQNNPSIVGASIDIGAFENTTPLGLNKFNQSKNVSIFPNPVSNKLNIQTGEGNTINKVSLYNSVGQFITVFNNPPSAISLTSLNLQKGIYFAKIEGNFGAETVKIIKE